jgi:Protein of unknown function (DUF2812)
MQTETQRIFKWFWVWQDEQEEAWLESLSRERGLHLESVGPLGTYTFRAGSPQAMIYRLDYQYLKGQDLPGYLQLFADAGWDHVGQMSNWHYFRRPEVAGQPREIFTDPESKAAKYRRLIPYVFLVCMLLGVQLNSDLYTRHPTPALEAVRLLLFGIFLVLGYSLVRIGYRIRELTRR